VPGTPLIKNCEACILAGGLSRRMGREKSRLRLGQRTMLGHVRAAARAAGLRVRVIRKDAVPRCGPLGGIYTALKSTRAQAVLFLACDMPFITADLLLWMLEHAGAEKNQPLFLRTRGSAGFPLLLPRAALASVANQIHEDEYSLQALAKVVKAKLIRPRHGFADQLHNLNTPTEWKCVHGYRRSRGEQRRRAKTKPLMR
jgi:molybdopterin-guanine dinucleotide biosynthesis protein A